jgi:hypothetical protein
MPNRRQRVAIPRGVFLPERQMGFAVLENVRHIAAGPLKGTEDAKQQQERLLEPRYGG